MVTPVKPSLNENIGRLVNSKTGATVEHDYSRPIGLDAGAPIVFEYDLSEISRQPVLPPFVNTSEMGMWRYAPLLPVIGVSESYADDVGQTPILLHEPLSEQLGVELYLKNEAANPSGSFKDRGLAVGVALGIACGAKRFCLPTQGNAGVACAMFSARAGIESALVYMPTGHKGTIYHRSAATYGAEVRFFGANIAETGRKMRADLEAELAAGEYVDISTFFEPGRLEGKKTMGLEIAESFGGDDLPHHILYPTGGGTGLVGIWKAFTELRGLGVLREKHQLPRMIAVQSQACAPVVRSFEQGLFAVEPVVSQGTCADGLDVPGAIMGHQILRVLRESDGHAHAVSEAAIVDQFRMLGRQGVSASFEGAATLAALVDLIKSGHIKKNERVLSLITAGAMVSLAGPGARALR